jgi:butyrate kinase
VTVSWLDRLADHVDDLESILATIVAAWESVPENVQVPDEINVDEMWDEARRVLGRPQSGG